MYQTSPRTLLTASNGGPRKLGPTSGMGQCLARHVSQDAEEWSGVVHQDVHMCPWQYGEGDVTSDIGDSNNGVGSREVGPRQHTSYQQGESSSRFSSNPIRASKGSSLGCVASNTTPPYWMGFSFTGWGS